MTDREKLHAELVFLEGEGANWQRIMVAHALVDLELVTSIECAMPRCIETSREFSYNGPGRQQTLSIDHSTPLSSGGGHRPENLRLAHLSCNSAAARFGKTDNGDIAHATRLARRRQYYASIVAGLALAAEDSTDDDDADTILDAFKNRDWGWLDSTRHLQRTAYGLDYSTLHDDSLADYITWNALALVDEVHEFLQEVQWKTWAKNRGRIHDRDAAVGELVDAGHFLANLAAALGVSDSEWEAKYREKQTRNAARQAAAGGYDSRAEKCPSCRRELDKPGATYRRSGRGVGAESTVHCKACDTRVGIVTATRETSSA